MLGKGCCAGKGCGAAREEQGPASAALSYPAAGRGAPPGGSPGCLCAAGLPAPAPAEPPGAGSAASRWSPARAEESREGRKLPWSRNLCCRDCVV